MKTVFKYELPMGDEVRVKMPAFARVLSVGVQYEHLFVWALVDKDVPELHKTFRIAGTGHPIEDVDKWNFIGTVQMASGQLIFHIFELDPKRELPN